MEDLALKKKPAALWIGAVFTLLMVAVSVQTANAEIQVATGINYLSSGNRWIDTDKQLDRDFSRFRRDGIPYTSARIMWDVMEPTYYPDSCHLDETALNDYKRVLEAAYRNGITVNVDFWTQYGYTLGLPSWVGDNYWLISEDQETLELYIRYVKAVVEELKDYPAVESWAILNEPWYWSEQGSQAGFENAFPQIVSAIKSVDPTHLVTCRFCLSHSVGSGRYNENVYDMFDVYALTIYLDPNNPNDSRYNSDWNDWQQTVLDLKARGKTCWIIEYGCSRDWDSDEGIRIRYRDALKKFSESGVVERMYAYAWQTRGTSIGPWNIYDGDEPYPCYYELTSNPPEPPPEPPSQEMYVSSIDLAKFGRSNVKCVAETKIVDTNGNPVMGASVTASWSGLIDGTDTAKTDQDGMAKFSLRVGRDLGEVIFTVTDVQKTGLTYEPSLNIETSENITV